MSVPAAATDKARIVGYPLPGVGQRERYECVNQGVAVAAVVRTDIEVSGERIPAAHDPAVAPLRIVVVTVLIHRVAVVRTLEAGSLRGQRHGSDAVGAVADVVGIAGDRFHHRAGVFELDDAVLESAAAQGRFGEERVGAGKRVPAVEFDGAEAAERHVVPVINGAAVGEKTALTPSGLREYGIDLIHRQSVHVPVHVHGERVQRDTINAGLLTVRLADASICSDVIGRLMGARSHRPRFSASGVVADPLACIWNLTSGCASVKASPQPAITSFMVSEPILVNVPASWACAQTA